MGQSQNECEEIPEEAWRFFHKVTPLTKGTALWAFVAVIFYNIVKEWPTEGLKSIHPSADIWFYVVLFVGGVLALSTLAVVAGWIIWKKQSFALVENGVHYRSGVLVKTRQHMLWERIQSVEIDQSLFGRIFGFGTVVVDSAAVGDRQLRLGLLTMADCGALRHELLNGLARKRSGVQITSHAHVIGEEGVHPSDTTTGGDYETGGDESADSQELVSASQEDLIATPAIPVFDPDDLVNDRLIYELNPWYLLIVRLVSGTGILALAYLVFTVWITVVTEGVSFGLILTALGVFYAVIKPAFTQWDTKVYISEHGLRVRSGLTSIRTITLPPERIHAISVSQSWLARALGWWTIDVTAAGRTTDDTKENLLSGVPVMPVGKITDLERLMWILRPQLGSDDDAALFAELTGTPDTMLKRTTQRARLFDPVQWKFRGFIATPSVIAIRKKRIGRAFTLIPADRWQSIAITQGPLQRRRGLASLDLNLVAITSMTVVKNYPLPMLQSSMSEIEELGAQARTVKVSETIDEWKTRIGL
ncbi:PH domain-containing protein [Arcanobacterium canis]